MNELIAKPVLKNKFWIVESEGHKIGTIQAVENGGFTFVNGPERQQFSTIKLLSKTHSVTFDKQEGSSSTKNVAKNNINNYPINSKAYNILWDCVKKFPIFTKSQKSKSYYCAGFYCVFLNESWTTVLCPKYITLNRYKYFGPFATQEEADQKLKTLSNG